jgi:hypothetical protein
MVEEQKTKIIGGIVHVRSKCSCCKRCWIAIGGPYKGKCSYGGPFEGFTPRKDKDLSNRVDWKPEDSKKEPTTPDGTLSEVSS